MPAASLAFIGWNMSEQHGADGENDRHRGLHRDQRAPSAGTD